MIIVHGTLLQFRIVSVMIVFLEYIDSKRQGLWSTVPKLRYCQNLFFAILYHY